jgi:hypothetical protein
MPYTEGKQVIQKIKEKNKTYHAQKWNKTDVKLKRRDRSDAYEWNIIWHGIK